MCARNEYDRGDECSTGAPRHRRGLLLRRETLFSVARLSNLRRSIKSFVPRLMNPKKPQWPMTGHSIQNIAVARRAKTLERYTRWNAFQRECGAATDVFGGRVCRVVV